MKFVVGLLLGLAAGIGIGLLIAPQTGEETRALLGDQGVALKASTISDDVRARANEALVQGRELYARTKNELSDRYNKARSGDL